MWFLARQHGEFKLESSSLKLHFEIHTYWVSIGIFPPRNLMQVRAIAWSHFDLEI